MRLTRVVHALRTSLWVVPLLCVLAGVLLAVVTLWLDRRSDFTLVPQSLTGAPSDVQTTLSLFATATASLISLVLTVTLVVVQLAMGQFSPASWARCCPTGPASWRSASSGRTSSSPCSPCARSGVPTPARCPA